MEENIKMSDGEVQQLWYSRNPVHETNADTGKDMFWGTLSMLFKDYAESQLLKQKEDRDSWRRTAEKLEQEKIELRDKNERLEEKEKLGLADAQILGFHYGQTMNMSNLISDMGLTKEEWKTLKKEYVTPGIIGESLVEEIDAALQEPPTQVNK